MRDLKPHVDKPVRELKSFARVVLQPGETVKTMLAVRNLEQENKYVFFATRKGLVKKSALREFMHVRSNGIAAITIEEGDELVAARITNGNQIVFIASHEGMAVRFDENHVRPMGRAAYGVNGMDLDEGDYLVGMEIVGDKELILSVTEKGYGKRTAITEYRLQSRAGKGVINVKTTERNGKVVAALSVTEESEVMIISQQGKITRLDSSKIRESGRAAQGVRLIQIEEGDQVAAACLVNESTPNGNGSPEQVTLIQ